MFDLNEIAAEFGGQTEPLVKSNGRIFGTVYARGGIYNNYFIIPWTKLGQSKNNLYSRGRYDVFNYEGYEIEVGPSTKKRRAVEALAIYMGKEKYGAGPEFYESRTNPGVPVKYEGWTETILATPEQGFELIQIAFKIVNQAGETAQEFDGRPKTYVPGVREKLFGLDD